MSEASADTQEVQSDQFIGAILGGRYRLIERLGEGGMGAVYRAEHLELEREVAIKLLAPELSRKRVNVERFQREARTASKIGHPNIIDVFDMGRAEDGTPYLVMERLEGHDLEEELETKGPSLSPERVVTLLRPIANALDTCHARGVIHRDIKPSNIFIARLGDGSEAPKVVDFGLAMLAASDARLTKTGFLAGTPHYLPPEAAHGDLPGESGDVYALATIAFEAICGALPFDSENAAGVLVQKVTMEAPALGAVARGVFPVEVEDVFRRALDQEPERRYPTAAAFIDALAAAIAEVEPGWGPDHGAPLKERLSYQEHREQLRSGVAARRTPPPSEVVSVPTNRRTAVVVLALVIAVALLGGLGAWWAFSDAGVDPVADPTEPPPQPPPEPTPREDIPVGELAPVVDPPEAPVVEAEPVAPEVPEAAEPAEAIEAPPPVVEDRPRPGRADRPAAVAPEEPPEPARDRGEAERLVRSAGSLLVRGDISAALAVLHRARAADPSYPATYRSLGLAYERSRQTNEARSAYERYLRLAPRAADAGRIRERVTQLGG